MNRSKEDLVRSIEGARDRLNRSIDMGEQYETIYKNSVELDRLIEQYIVSGF